MQGRLRATGAPGGRREQNILTRCPKNPHVHLQIRPSELQWDQRCDPQSRGHRESCPRPENAQRGWQLSSVGDSAARVLRGSSRPGLLRLPKRAQNKVSERCLQTHRNRICCWWAPLPRDAKGSSWGSEQVAQAVNQIRSEQSPAKGSSVLREDRVHLTLDTFGVTGAKPCCPCLWQLLQLLLLFLRFMYFRA